MTTKCTMVNIRCCVFRNVRLGRVSCRFAHNGNHHHPVDIIHNKAHSSHVHPFPAASSFLPDEVVDWWLAAVPAAKGGVEKCMGWLYSICMHRLCFVVPHGRGQHFCVLSVHFSLFNFLDQKEGNGTAKRKKKESRRRHSLSLKYILYVLSSFSAKLKIAASIFQKWKKQANSHFRLFAQLLPADIIR